MLEFKAGSFLPKLWGEEDRGDWVRNWGREEKKIRDERNQGTQSEVNGYNLPSDTMETQEG